MWKQSPSHNPEKLTGTTPNSPQHSKLAEGDWGAFTSLCLEIINYNGPADLPDPSKASVPPCQALQTKPSPKPQTRQKKHRKPWFDNDCKTAVSKSCVQALVSKANAAKFTYLRMYCAKARRRTINLTKRYCWQSYVSKLNSQTQMKKISSMIRRISGKPTTTSTNHLVVNSTTIEQPT